MSCAHEADTAGADPAEADPAEVGFAVTLAIELRQLV